MRHLPAQMQMAAAQVAAELMLCAQGQLRRLFQQAFLVMQLQ